MLFFNFQVMLRSVFWAKMRPEVGVVQGRLRRVLDAAGLTGCFNLSMLVDDIIIEGLQTMANTYRDKLFPGSNLDSFKFTSFDKGVMKRIASKITENGIDKYLPEEPAENGNRNLDQNRSDLHTIDVDKESQALCARFADRYAE